MNYIMIKKIIGIDENQSDLSDGMIRMQRRIGNPVHPVNPVKKSSKWTDILKHCLRCIILCIKE